MQRSLLPRITVCMPTTLTLNSIYNANHPPATEEGCRCQWWGLNRGCNKVSGVNYMFKAKAKIFKILGVMYTGWIYGRDGQALVALSCIAPPPSHWTSQIFQNCKIPSLCSTMMLELPYPVVQSLNRPFKGCIYSCCLVNPQIYSTGLSKLRSSTVLEELLRQHSSDFGSGLISVTAVHGVEQDFIEIKKTGRPK